MKRVALTALGLGFAANTALAGGIERAVPSLDFMFQDGNYAEISTALINPSVSGTQAISLSATSLAGTSSGNMSGSYGQSAIALKLQLSEALSFGLVVDQPIGADVAYPFDPTAASSYAFAGSTASINASEVRGILKYTLPSNISLIAGLRSQTAAGTVSLPGFGPSGYALVAPSNTETGFLAGVAWEKKDIAARVALTYYSAMEHTFAALEGDNTGVAASLPFTSVIPEAWRLDFQTGVAPGTLVFGSVHHQKWSKFDITPVGFAAASGGSSLVNLTNDVTTYTLGVGRQLNDRWAVSGSVAYEKANGGFSGNLSPTDGRTTIGLGVRYKTDGMATISGGISYSIIGDAVTGAPSPAPAGTTLANFENNSTFAIGFKVGFNF